MLEFFNKLKRKPKHVRSRIAFFSTIGIFFVIVNIWWLSFKSPINDSSIPVTEVVTPLGVVANMVMGMKDSAQHVADTLQGQLQYTTPDGNEGSQTASVAASESSGTAVYPDQVFNEKKATTSSHSLSN